MRVFVATICLLFSSIATSQAAILVTYAMNKADPESATVSSMPTSSDPGVIVSSLNADVGTFDVSPSSGTAFLRTNASEATLAAAINPATDDYLEFTLSPAVGQTLNLTSFIFDHEVSTSGTNATSSFTSNLSIFASIDGFATNPVSGDALGTSTAFQSGDTSGNAVVLADDVTYSLGAAQFQGLTSGQTVTFRVYGFDDFNSNDHINRIDDIRIVGDVAAIPEPSSMLLLLGSAAGLFIWRRRVTPRC